jgi:hypothetical protein
LILGLWNWKWTVKEDFLEKPGIPAAIKFALCQFWPSHNMEWMMDALFAVFY